MEIEGAKNHGLEGGAGPIGRRAEPIRMGAAGRMSGRELRDFAAEQRRMGIDELAAFGAAQARHRDTRAHLEQELAAAWAELLQVSLPTLEGPAMERLATRLGLVEMEPGALARRSQARQAELVAALAEIDRDPLLIEAARVCAALDQKRKDLEERLDRLGQTLDALEAEPLFFKLIAARFDTSEYEGRFWQRRYHRHRRQARELLSRHGEALGVRRFRQLYRRYVFEKASFDRLFLARGSLQARAAEVAAVARRRHQIEMELGSLPEWELAYARAGIRQHLQPLAETEQLAFFIDDPAASPLAELVVALQGRLRRLAALRTECLDAPRAEVEGALARVDGVLAEMASPRRKLDAVHARDEMERSYGLPLARWRELRRRFDDQAGQPS